MMQSRLTYAALLLLLVSTVAIAGPRFRSLIFLHHSTGGCIWGPNGGTVSVPGELASYNRLHALSGADSIKMAETWWPSSDNEWVTWHAIFDNKSSSDNIQSYLTSYPVIMIKSCFPSSSMTGVGTYADTLSPTTKSIANYKWHWRSIVAVMKSRPQTFFIIWTNAPLDSGSTNTSEAVRSNQFCRWAKDTLAAGLDPITGAFPKNVFVFDFFHSLAGASGILPSKYAASNGDSHPNATATTIATPQLVKQVCDAMLAYEVATGVDVSDAPVPAGMQLEQNFPNPFNPTTKIGFGVSGLGSRVRLSVCDLLGREVAVLVDEVKQPGRYSATWDATGMPSGVYYYRMDAGGKRETKAMMLLK